MKNKKKKELYKERNKKIWKQYQSQKVVSIKWDSLIRANSFCFLLNGKHGQQVATEIGTTYWQTLNNS